MFVKNHALQQDLRHQEVIRSNLLRQFSPQVAGRLEGLLKESGNLRLGGKRADPVTILTSDVRGFTSLSAEMEPNELVEMLNDLFGVCIPIIFKYNGTIDKYVGDAILAVFGSPDPDEHQWENAVRAAIAMQAAINELDKERRAQGLPVCQVGIGIHTGAVLHGFIGSEEHMEFTVIGDAVNRASRYCDGAGSGEIIISQAVYEHVSDLVEVVPKIIKPKHPDTESDLKAYLVTDIRSLDDTQ
jgi:adenylate cyclase